MNRADVFHSVRPGRRAVPAMKGSAGSFDPARSALRSGRKRTGAGMRKGVSIGFALLVLMVPLGACKREDPQAAVQAEAAQAAAAEQAAMQVEQQFAAAVAKQDWSLARGYGEVLLMDHPGTQAAARVEAQLVEVRAKVAEADSQSRLRALWSYQSEPVKGGNQLSASIFASQPVDTGGGARQVRLIFRDHPDWGRSSYLTLEAGDFDCYGGCRVLAAVDDAAPRAMAASRPDTDEAIAMFIEDERALWRLVKDARVLRIEFPVKAGGRRTAEFEVGGLDPARMPGW